MSYIEKRLEICDVDEVFKLQKIALSKIDNNEIFHPDTREEVEKYISNGICLGLYDQNELIAYQLIIMPSEKDSLINYLPDYISKSLRALHFETTIVAPEYRGQGLQKRMKIMNLDIIKRENLADIICNTVHPLNYPSVFSSLGTGAKVAGIKELYNGKARFIFCTPIIKSLFFTYEKELLKLNLKDFDGIAEAIKDGYVGHKIVGDSILLCRIDKAC